jgi:hypothetical protein
LQVWNGGAAGAVIANTAIGTRPPRVSSVIVFVSVERRRPAPRISARIVAARVV